MDSVAQAILLTQIPIAIGIFIGAYEVWKVKNELLEILRKLSKK